MPDSPVPPLPVAVLISGGGTTFKNLIDHRSRHDLPVDIRLVVSSSAQAAGLRYAQEEGIESRVVLRCKELSPAEFSEAVFDPIRAAGAQTVVMGGFLKHVLIPSDFENRVVNIHPGLIPAFCGKGFYGLRVHQAVLDYGAKVSGCTVHFVDDDYDHGPIILQRTVPVYDDDTAEQLQQRVFQEECLAYPQALRLLAEDRVRVEGRLVRILKP